MRIFEITTPLRSFNATVRIGAGVSSKKIKTRVNAEGLMQARALLLHLYGAGNVLSVN